MWQLREATLCQQASTIHHNPFQCREWPSRHQLPKHCQYKQTAAYCSSKNVNEQPKLLFSQSTSEDLPGNLESYSGGGQHEEWGMTSIGTIPFVIAWTQVWCLTFSLAYGGVSIWAQLKDAQVQDLSADDIANAALVMDLLQLLGVSVILKNALQRAQNTQALQTMQVFQALDWGHWLTLKPTPPALLQSCAAAAVALGGVAALESLFGTSDDAANAKQLLDLLQQAGVLSRVELIASNVLLGPMTEELFYRGFLLPSLMQHISMPAALALSSAAFAAFHLSAQDFGVLALLGAILGCSMIISRGNLLVPILAHAMYNLAAISVFVGSMVST